MLPVSLIIHSFFRSSARKYSLLCRCVDLLELTRERADDGTHRGKRTDDKYSCSEYANDDV